MKRKILTIITIGSIFLMALTGCADFSYRNPVKADTTTYVAEYPYGSQVEITKEEAEDIKEFQEELGITEESLYEEVEEEAEAEIEEETVKTPFNINTALGSEKGKFSSLGVQYKIYENGAEIAWFENENAVIPEEIEYEGETYPVISLGDEFLYYTYDHSEYEVNEFEIPSHIKYIREYAFASSKLESLVIPETVEYVSGYHTFAGCKNLKNITFLGEFETDSEWNGTFSECWDLQTAFVPEGVTNLKGCFNGCGNLTSVSLPNSLKTIGENCFYYCESLTEVTIPDSVTTIEDWAFIGAGIKHIDIPEGLETLFSGAFDKCSELEELIIPDTVISYGVTYDRGLKDMNALKTLKFSNNCDELEYFFKYHTPYVPKLELVIFPDSLQDLPDNIFDSVEDKSNLTIQVPEKTVEYFQNVFPEINVVAKE